MVRVKLAFMLFLFMFGLVSAVPLINVTTAGEARIGDSLNVVINMAKSVPADVIANLPCVVYTIDQNNNTIDLIAYDSILNEPPALKTNAGGKAYHTIYITDRYDVFTVHRVFADCGGNVNSTSFSSLPYTPTDQMSNILISLTKDTGGWLILTIAGFIAIISIAWGVNKIV